MGNMTEVLTSFIEENQGPWLMSFFATEVDKPVEEAHFGYMHFFVESFSFDNGIFGCYGHEGYNLAQFVLEALYDPRIHENTLLLSYYNTVTNLPDEQQMVWCVGIKPLGE
jgi:hypothetical protein